MLYPILDNSDSSLALLKNFEIIFVKAVDSCGSIRGDVTRLLLQCTSTHEVYFAGKVVYFAKRGIFEPIMLIT